MVAGWITTVVVGTLGPVESSMAQSGLGRGADARPDSLAVSPVESPSSVHDAADRAGVGPALVRVEDLLGERLGTALADTRKFTMVTRAKLDAVLAEQAFAASGFVDARDPNAARAMQVAGVRWLAVPRVIDFEDAVRTRRFAGLDREVSRRTVRIAIAVDVLDSTTGVVGETATVTVESTDTADEDVRARPEGTGPNASLLDTLATAAASKVACRLLDVAYPATVLAANGSVITINRGDGGCLSAGEMWIATRRGEPLVDPDTGEVLGFDEADTGVVEVTRLEARLARARVVAGAVSPGDVLRPLPEGVSVETLRFDGAGGGGRGMTAPAAGRPATPDWNPRDRTSAGRGDPQAAKALADLGPVAVVAVGSDVSESILRSLETEVAGATAAEGLRIVDPTNVVARRAEVRFDGADASLLRLAEAVGARWLLVVSVGSDDGGTSTASVNGEVFRTTTRSIRGSWRLVAGGDAASVAGQVYEGTARRMEASGGGAVAVDVSRPLDREAASAAAVTIADGLAGAAGLLAAAGTASDGFIRIEASLDGLVVPEIVQSEDGVWRVEATSLPVMVGGVEVALDGFVVGSTPCTVKASVGPHRLRLTRQGVESWDRAVRVLGRAEDDPQVVTVGLRPTAEARDRYLENAAVVRGLEAGAALTEAQTEAILGFAAFLRQSGYRVDVRQSEDVVIESDQVPQTMQWNSFWSRW